MNKVLSPPQGILWLPRYGSHLRVLLSHCWRFGYSIISFQITLVKQRFCKCIIKCIGDTVLSRPYRGMLRKEDVRATEKDKVEMIKCFRPGDIILARVVSFWHIFSTLPFFLLFFLLRLMFWMVAGFVILCSHHITSIVFLYILN